MSRATILGKLRALGGDPALVEARCAAPPPPLAAQWRDDPEPGGGTRSLSETIASFRRRAAEVQMEVHSVAPRTVASTIASVLQTLNLPAEIAVAQAAEGDWGWEETPLLTRIKEGRRQGNLTASLVRAEVAAAETATLLASSSALAPTQYHFLPQVSFALLDAREIYADLEGATRAIIGRQGVPRSLNFITGPSRTGDIEQTLFLGAHGPGALHVLLFEAPA